MHGHAVHIFAAAKTVAVEVVHEQTLLPLILPDTHRRTAPEVARLVFNDATHHFVGQHFSSREGHDITLAVVIEIETCVGADQDLVLRGLINGLNGIIVEHHLPAVWSEMVFYRIIAVDTRRRTDPQLPLTVEEQM